MAQANRTPAPPAAAHAAKPSSLIDKKEAIANELELSGSMKAVAAVAASKLGINTAGMALPDQVQACAVSRVCPMVCVSARLEGHGSAI